MDRRFLERGDDFSAGQRREANEKTLIAGTDFYLPRKQAIEDSIDWHGIPRASESQPIPPDNKGYLLLCKMGWKGTGLGRNANGLVAPVDTSTCEPGLRTGLGRAAEEAARVAAETASRRALAVEEQAREDVVARAARLARALNAERTQKTVQEMTRSFYCEDCDKQYKSAAEMGEHLSSYDHHHRKRLKEMRRAEQERTRDARSRKEQRRAAREEQRLLRQVAIAGSTGQSGLLQAGALAHGGSWAENDDDTQPPLPPSGAQAQGAWAAVDDDTQPPLPPVAGTPLPLSSPMDEPPPPLPSQPLPAPVAWPAHSFQHNARPPTGASQATRPAVTFGASAAVHAAASVPPPPPPSRPASGGASALRLQARLPRGSPHPTPQSTQASLEAGGAFRSTRAPAAFLTDSYSVPIQLGRSAPPPPAPSADPRASAGSRPCASTSSQPALPPPRIAAKSQEVRALFGGHSDED